MKLLKDHTPNQNQIINILQKDLINPHRKVTLAIILVKFIQTLDIKGLFSYNKEV